MKSNNGRFSILSQMLSRAATFIPRQRHLRSEEAHSLGGADQPIAISQEVSNKAFSTEFLLFLGDFIYADVPVFFGDSTEAYRRLYRRTYASPSFRKIYEKLRKYVFENSV